MQKHPQPSLSPRCSCAARAGSGDGGSDDDGEGRLSSYLLAVGSLTLALLMRAIGGWLQELHFRTYGLCVSEVLFWRGALGLPFFLCRSSNLARSFRLWNEQDVPVLGHPLPIMWFLLVGNVICDHCCKVTMTHLIAKTSALTATIVFTVSRTSTIVFSALVLAPQLPPLLFWQGVLLVIGGTVLYTCTAPRKEPSSSSSPITLRAGTPSGAKRKDE